jgi:uncharacterized repeat protein (TIGR01451 family)
MIETPRRFTPKFKFKMTRRMAAASLGLVLLVAAKGMSVVNPTLTATLVDNFTNVQSAVPGDTISYTATITNNSGSDATGVEFNPSIDPSTTLVNGSVHASPLARNDAFSAVGNTLLEAGVSASGNSAVTTSVKLFDNDSQVNGTGATDSFQYVSHTGPTNGVLVSFNTTTGAFSYQPNAGFTGTDTFTYTLRNSANASLTDTATVSINVSNKVWYVDSTRAAEGTGTSSSPLKSFASLNTAASDVDGDGDTIYIKGGPVGPIVLEANQRLIGAGSPLVVNGFTLASDTGTNSTVFASIGYAVTLGTNNTIAGLNITGTTSNSGILGTSFGTLTVTEGVVLNASSQALNLNTGSVAGSGFASTTSTGAGGMDNVTLLNVNGTVNLGSGSLSGASGTTSIGVNISGGTANIDFDGTVSKSNNGRAIHISSKTGGTVQFDGSVTSDSLSDGISLDSNSSTTFNFLGGVFINTGSSGTSGITATNNSAANTSTLVITGTTNTIDSGSGTALNVTNTTIGAGGVTFRSVSSNGSSGSGLVLDNVGAGGFTITGLNSVANSGGTFANKSGGDGSTTSGIGIYINNAQNISLANLNFDGTFSNFGIRGTNVNNFTLRDSTIDANFGDNGGLDEGAVRFGDQTARTSGLTGTCVLEGNTIQGGWEDNLDVYNYGSSILNLTIKDSASDQAVFGLTQNAVVNGSGNDNIHIESGDTSRLTLNIDGITNGGARGDLLQIVAADSTTQSLTVQNSAFHNAVAGTIGGGVYIGGGGNASNYNVTFNVANNTFKGAHETALSLKYLGQSATINGVVLNNTVGTPGNGPDNTGASAGGLGIGFDLEKFAGTGIMNAALRIQGNTVRDLVGSAGGIYLSSGNDGTSGVARVEAAVINNSVAETLDLYSGLYTMVADNTSDNAQMGLKIVGNSFAAGASASGGNAVTFDQGGLNTFGNYYFPGYAFNATNNRGEDRGGGIASTGLTNFLTDNTHNNTLINGGSPYPATAVSATLTYGITGNNFVLATPLMFPASAGTPSDARSAGSSSAVLPQPTQASVTTTSASRPDVTSFPVTSPSTRPQALHGAGDMTLSQSELNALITSALSHWQNAGATSKQLAALRRIDWRVRDLAGWYLGEAASNVITVDADAAGNGWYIDRTPTQNEEFADTASQLMATSNGAAHGRVDALTAVLHEMGHVLGLGDSYLEAQRESIMYGWLPLSERRLPQMGEAVGATPSNDAHPHFIGTPITIGTLPTGKSITIEYQATVNNPIAAGVASVSSQGTVTGTGINLVTDDTETGTAGDATATTINAAPDLKVTSMSDGVAAATPTTSATALNYAINYVNAGNQGASGVALTMNVPAGTTFNAAGSTAGWTETPAGSGTYKFNVGALAGGGANGSVTFSVHVINPAPAGLDQVVAAVSIADDGANGADATPADNTATDSDTLNAAPVISVTKVDALQTNNAGAANAVNATDKVRYTITVTNTGNQGAANVVVTDTPDSNTTLVVGDVTTSAGTVATGNGAGHTTVAVNVGTLAGNGGTATISFDVTVNDPFPVAANNQISNQALVAYDNVTGLQSDDPAVTGGANATVTPVVTNTAPVTQGFAITTWVGRAVINRPTAASDVDGDTLSYSLNTAIGMAPEHGDVTGVASTDGLFLYTPDAGYSGGDSFTLNVSDGSATTPLTVTVTVGAAPAADKRIYTSVGASDANAVGASDFAHGYTSLLQSKMNAMYGAGTWALSNRGVNGFTAKDLRRVVGGQSVLSLTQADAPRAVTLWVGPNDVKDYFLKPSGQTPVQFLTAFSNDYSAVMSALKAIPEVALVTANVPRIGNAPIAATLTQPERDAINGMCQQVSTGIGNIAFAAGNVRVVDLYSQSATVDLADFAGDGFHPSDAGYLKLANNFWPLLRPQLNRAPVAATPASFSAKQGEAKILTLEGTDPDLDESELSSIISTLPTRGTLYDGPDTTTPISTVPHTVADTQRRVTFKSETVGTGSFGFKVSDSNTSSVEKSVSYTVSDATAPATPVVLVPANGSKGQTLVEVSGTASDTAGGSGVTRVEFLLYQASSGLIWSGNAATPWTSTKKWIQSTVDSANGTWSYRNADNTPDLPSGMALPSGNYTVFAYSYDAAGNRSAGYGVSRFAIDKSVPLPTITSPANGSGVRALSKIHGQASDHAGGSGITSVELTLQRSDEQYWTGTQWQTAFALLSTVRHNASWNSSATLPAGDDLAAGNYVVGVIAEDALGNRSARATSSFVVDKVLPALPVVLVPANGSKNQTTLTEVSGTASDNAGGSGVKRVAFLLYQVDTGLFWSGSAWTSTRTMLESTVDSANSTWSYRNADNTLDLPSGDALPSGNYTVFAYSYDAAGNRSLSYGASRFFIAKGIVPPPPAPDAEPRVKSSVTLSSVSADAASDTVTLTFTGAVKSGAAAGYAVTVAGAAVEVTAVQQKTAQTVVLQLEDDLQAGGAVVVDYSISDSKGLPLSGQAKATAK